VTEKNGATSRGKLSVRAGVSRKLLERKAAERVAAAGAPEGEGVEALFPVAEPSGGDHTGGADHGPFCALHDQHLPDQVAERDTALAGADETVMSGEPSAEQSDWSVQQPVQASSTSAGGAPATVPEQQASLLPAPAATATAPQPAAPALWSDEDESAYQSLLARRIAAGRGGRSKAVADQLIGLGSIKPNPNTIVAVIVGMVAKRGGSMPRGELLTAMANATFPHPKAQPADRGWCQGYVAGAVRNGFLTVGAEPAIALPVAA